MSKSDPNRSSEEEKKSRERKSPLWYPEEAQPPRRQWLVFLWLVIAILFLSYYFDAAERRQVQVELGYSEFLDAVEAGHVDQVTLRGQSIEGQFSEAGRQAWEEQRQQQGQQDGQQQGEQGQQPTVESFETIRPVVEDQRLLERLEANDVKILAEPTEPPWWQSMLVNALPWILILGLLFWFWNRMQQRMMSGGGPLNMGQSKARQVRSEDSDVRMDDVAGCENAKRDVTEFIDFLKKPDHFLALGARIPRGILLMGPPGTGKTLMAKAVAGEAGVPFFSISGSEFIEMFVGVGASRVRDLFKKAKEQAPSVIFIDELDSIGRSRGAGMGGGHDEREQTLNQILAEMDGFEAEESVIVLSATNRPDVLDSALLRPGRFDRKVTLEKPHREARRDILKVHTRKMPLAENVDLEQLARITTGFSGADLANLANEAALLAGRRDQKEVDWDCFVESRDRLLLGAAKDVGLSDEERHLVAYHESGHALLAYLLPHADPLEKVTVLPRGQALGVTAQVPDEDRYNHGEAYLKDRITVMFGGRLAESIVFNEVSSGAQNDLEQATQLARSMVARWGMNEKVGPVMFAQSQEHVFLGKEMAQQREHSEDSASLVDQEIRNLLLGLEERGRRLLVENREALDALASTLEQEETLEVDEIREVLEGRVKEGKAEKKGKKEGKEEEKEGKKGRER